MDFSKSADNTSHCIIEAGNTSHIAKPDSDDRKKAKLTRSQGIKIISLTEFITLLVKIRKRPSRLFNRRLEPEAERYNRLMDDLEDDIDPPGCYAKVLLAAEVLLLLGLVAALVVTVTVREVKDDTFLTLTLWHWVVLVTVLVSGMTAVRFLTFLVFTPVKWRWRIHRTLDEDITYSSQTKVAKKEVTREDIRMIVYFKYLVSYLSAETKAMHKSRILTKIMELNKEMKYNIEKSSSVSELGQVHFILPEKVTMEKIDELKSKMFDNEFQIYKEHSKMLMTGLDNKKIEMVVHLKYENSEYIKDSDNLDLKDFEQHVASLTSSLGGQLKGRGLWSSRLSEKVLSPGRTSIKENQKS